MEKITSFTQLRTWQNARHLAVHLYEVTRTFPADERFGLTSQLRRAAVSVAANIAEGFSRNTAKDKVNFYGMALGSLTETMSHMYISYDLGYIDKDSLQPILTKTDELQKMIHGLIKTAAGKKA